MVLRCHVGKAYLLALLLRLVACEDDSGTAIAAPRSERGLTLDSVPQKILDAEYAVRGEIVILGEDGNHSLPFDELVACNIGNPQAVGAKPVTFHRQVLSLLSNPSLLEAGCTVNVKVALFQLVPSVLLFPFPFLPSILCSPWYTSVVKPGILCVSLV
eukprot:s821_g10.t1